MPDNKREVGCDRKRVAAGQAYKLSYFRRKHGLTADQAKDVSLIPCFASIRRIGTAGGTMQR